MKGLDNYLDLYILSNAVALFMMFTAWKAPKVSRLMFFLLFAWAGYTNWTTAIHNPYSYLNNADLALLNVYKQFIFGWFSKHIIVMVGFIATCQVLIAISMLLKGQIFKTGCIGAIVFLLAIAPLGVGAAFPCTVIMAAALFMILKNSPAQYLWIKAQKEKTPNNFNTKLQ